MNKKKALVIGCASILVFGLAVVICLVLFVVHVTKGVEGASLTVNSPMEVTVGQTFDMEVTVKNERSKKPLALSDVDIAEVYLEGFTITTVEPAAKSNMHVPVDNSRSYTFDVSIPAGASKTFTFKLRAEKAGIYRGDVDACENMQFITGLAQTVVKEKL